MLHHRDQPLNSAYGVKGGSSDGSSSSSSSLRNRKCDKDGNFNFLPGKDNEGTGGGGDENRNPVRPRNLGPLGRDLPNSSSSSSSSSGYHQNPGLLSPRSRTPCWGRLEPPPEMDCGDDGYGRVPPDGAEEGRLQGEEGRRPTKMSHGEETKVETRRRKSSVAREEMEDPALQENEDEWGDSDSESEVSHRSGGSASSVAMDSGGEGTLMGGWDRIGVGEPKADAQEADAQDADAQEADAGGNGDREPAGRRRSVGRRRSLTASNLGKLREECGEDEGADRSSDSGGDAVWTLRDRERFKAQEMEKHQEQLTMYRRLALIRWVRTLQGRIQEQQDRLQSSFDVILTQRKELLRMGVAAAVALSQS
ncbi:uncharacterized protein LOC130195024 isoform X2 [Pseudoliparis swirei]|nr:uncharacterized protein LOC130195024 isoform X2 [Pseudoliparis swirei]